MTSRDEKYSKPWPIYDMDENGHDTKKVLALAMPASEESIRAIMLAEENDPDGRSPFMFFRLANGDLILGCFPCGETYFETENDHS